MPAAVKVWAALLGFSAVCWAAGAAGSPPAARRFQDFEFQRLNRSYRDVAGAVEPVESGPFRVLLSSPRHEARLLRHRLRLEPLADGTHFAEVWAQFQGSGRLVADVSALGFETRLQDDMVVPRQEKLLEGRVRVARSREGFLFTPVALPRSADVRIQSRVGTDGVAWCERWASLPFSPLRCDGLAQALSRATVPLPAPGETYLLGYDELTDDERKKFGEYLEGRH